MIILEDVYKVISKKYSNKVPQDVIDYYHKNLTNKSHLEWVINQHLKGNVDKDSFDNVNNLLVKFKNNKEKLANADINNYNVENLHHAVSGFKTKENPYYTHVSSGFHNGKPYSITLSHNHEANKYLAKLDRNNINHKELNGKASWCTAVDNREGEWQFNTYSGHGDLYQIKLGDRVYQHDVNQDGKETFMNEFDKTVTGDELKELKEVANNHINNNTKINSENEYRDVINKGKRVKHDDIKHLSLKSDDMIEHSFKHFGTANINKSHQYHKLSDINLKEPTDNELDYLASNQHIPLIKAITKHATIDNKNLLNIESKLDRHSLQNIIDKNHLYDGTANTLYHKRSDMRNSLVTDYGDDILSHAILRNIPLSEKAFTHVINNKNVTIDDVVNEYATHYKPNKEIDNIILNKIKSSTPNQIKSLKIYFEHNPEKFIHHVPYLMNSL